MILKWIFDRVVSLLGLLILWPVLLVVAILIKVKMPGGPVLFVKDIQMIFCTVLGRKMRYAGEEI